MHCTPKIIFTKDFQQCETTAKVSEGKRVLTSDERIHKHASKYVIIF